MIAEFKDLLLCFFEMLSLFFSILFFILFFHFYFPFSFFRILFYSAYLNNTKGKPKQSKEVSVYAAQV